MIVVITGSMCGMGESAARYFLEKGHFVHGIDILPASVSDISDHPNYMHHNADVSNKDNLPNISGVEILINNAGIWDSGRDIDINLRGVMNCTEAYALGNESIQSVLNQCDILALRGLGFPEYVASKGGVYAYTRWTAQQLAPVGATCNCLSFGGVYTEASDPVVKDGAKWNKIMDMTPMRKWVSSVEAAKWIYFMSVENKSCSGQNIVIDNMESLKGEFVW